MRVLVTGATGFVGRWLTPELRAAGHEVIAAPGSRELDAADEASWRRLLALTTPDAIAHLAGMAYRPDAVERPEEALRVNAGGTAALIDAWATSEAHGPVLVTGSSDVYGTPTPRDLPLSEAAPVQPVHPYGRSKVAQEHVALERARRFGLPLVVTRSFNHTGPGQREVFVAPALARRILDARRTGDGVVRVGNLDARRDFTDVRDVVRAYRLILEWLVRERPQEPLVVNVASGHSVSVRELLELIARAARFEPTVVVDPALVRPDDPPEITGDASRLRALTGWQPQIPLEQTIADLVTSLEAEASPAAPSGTGPG